MAIAGIVLGGAALAFAARGVDMAGLAAAFGAVSWWWIAAAAAANGVTIVAQGIAWRVGLAAGGMGAVSARHTIAATWIGRAGNQLLPGKAGEIARIVVIRRHIAPDCREVSRIVGSVVAQRAFNILATFLVVTSTTFFVPVPAQVPGGHWGPAVALGAVAGFAVLSRYIRSRRATRVPGGGALRSVARRFTQGAGLLRPGRLAARALALHFVSVAAQLAMMSFLLRGFGVAAPPTAPLLIIALVGIAGAVPGAPGGAGLTQAALVAPLGAIYGVAPATALAFSLGLQATIAGVALVGGTVAAIHHRLAATAFP